MEPARAPGLSHAHASLRGAAHATPPGARWTEWDSYEALRRETATLGRGATSWARGRGGSLETPKRRWCKAGRSADEQVARTDDEKLIGMPRTARGGRSRLLSLKQTQHGRAGAMDTMDARFHHSPDRRPGHSHGRSCRLHCLRIADREREPRGGPWLTGAAQDKARSDNAVTDGRRLRGPPEGRNAPRSRASKRGTVGALQSTLRRLWQRNWVLHICAIRSSQRRAADVASVPQNHVSPSLRATASPGHARPPAPPPGP